MALNFVPYISLAFYQIHTRMGSISTIKQTLHQSHTVLGMTDNTSLLFYHSFYHRMTSQTTKLTHALNSQQENEANIFCKKSLHKFFVSTLTLS